MYIIVQVNRKCELNYEYNLLIFSEKFCKNTKIKSKWHNT